MQRSRIIADRINSGKCATVGASYALTDGRIRVRNALGTVGEQDATAPLGARSARSSRMPRASSVDGAGAGRSRRLPRVRSLSPGYREIL